MSALSALGYAAALLLAVVALWWLVLLGACLASWWPDRGEGGRPKAGCVNRMRAEGVGPIPRTCPDCGLGPCKQGSPGRTPDPRPNPPSRAFLCGIVSMCGPNGEPLACAYPPYHEGDHSWATLPTFADGHPIGYTPITTDGG